MSAKQKWLVGLSMFLSICAAILSVIAICRTSERSLGLDYIGVIVGVLGATITVLIGWQIFALVDARSIKSDLEQIQTDLKNEIYRNCGKSIKKTHFKFYFEVGFFLKILLR